MLSARGPLPDPKGAADNTSSFHISSLSFGYLSFGIVCINKRILQVERYSLTIAGEEEYNGSIPYMAVTEKWKSRKVKWM